MTETRSVVAKSVEEVMELSAKMEKPTIPLLKHRPTVEKNTKGALSTSDPDSKTTKNRAVLAGKTIKLRKRAPSDDSQVSSVPVVEYSSNWFKEPEDLEPGKGLVFNRFAHRNNKKIGNHNKATAPSEPKPEPVSDTNKKHKKRNCGQIEVTKGLTYTGEAISLKKVMDGGMEKVEKAKNKADRKTKYKVKRKSDVKKVEEMKKVNINNEGKGAKAKSDRAKDEKSKKSEKVVKRKIDVKNVGEIEKVNNKVDKMDMQVKLYSENVEDASRKPGKVENNTKGKPDVKEVEKIKIVDNKIKEKVTKAKPAVKKVEKSQKKTAEKKADYVLKRKPYLKKIMEKTKINNNESNEVKILYEYALLLRDSVFCYAKDTTAKILSNIVKTDSSIKTTIRKKKKPTTFKDIVKNNWLGLARSREIFLYLTEEEGRSYR